MILKIIIIICVLVLIGGIIYAIYYIATLPTINEIEYREILIDAKDGNKPIITNFSIYGNGSLLLNSITRDDSYVKVKIPLGYNLNIYPTHQNYYSKREVIGRSKHTILLEKIGNITITQNNKLSEGNSVILNLTTDSINKNIGACVRWSNNIIDVNTSYLPYKFLNNKFDCESEGHVWMNETTDCSLSCKMGFVEANVTPAKCSVSYINLLPPERLKGKVDRCFYFNTDLTNNNIFKLSLIYKSYTITQDDYINIYVIDSDYRENKLVFEDANKNDIGGKDYLYIIK